MVSVGLKEIEEQNLRIKASMAEIRHKLVIFSGKGGVGKSTVTTNLATALAWRGHPDLVGILDADITGPSIPKILGLRGMQLPVTPGGLLPAIGPLGIKVVSMDFLLTSDETPIIWRGPLKSAAIRQFLADVVWGSLEFLLIDLPPGTGDEALSIMQMLPDIDGVIIVTIPSEVSQLVVKKSVTFTRKMNRPIIGVIENMSGFVCPKCGTETAIFTIGGGEQLSKELNIPFLGRVPLDPRISEASDKGIPFIVDQPEAPSAQAFAHIVDRIEEHLSRSGTKPPQNESSQNR